MLATVVQLLGLGTVIAGVALLSVPVAIIVTGALLATAGYLLERE